MLTNSFIEPRSPPRRPLETLFFLPFPPSASTHVKAQRIAMPKRLSRQPSSHSIDLGNQGNAQQPLDTFKSELVSNGAGYDSKDEARGMLHEGKSTSGELSRSDVKAIALLVVLCECLPAIQARIRLTLLIDQICFRGYQSDWHSGQCPFCSRRGYHTATLASSCSLHIPTLSSFSGVQSSIAASSTNGELARERGSAVCK
jgi:hypothetical protein